MLNASGKVILLIKVGRKSLVTAPTQNHNRPQNKPLLGAHISTFLLSRCLETSPPQNGQKCNTMPLALCLPDLIITIDLLFSPVRMSEYSSRCTPSFLTSPNVLAKVKHGDTKRPSTEHFLTINSLTTSPLKSYYLLCPTSG